MDIQERDDFVQKFEEKFDVIGSVNQAISIGN